LNQNISKEQHEENTTDINQEGNCEVTKLFKTHAGVMFRASNRCKKKKAFQNNWHLLQNDKGSNVPVCR
jgi:hypothetical protein